MPYTYETDGATIYKGSFATIRAEADLARFDDNHESIAVRMIHAAGMVDLAQHFRYLRPSSPRRIAKWRADPVRCLHGVRGCYAQTSACRQ